MPRPRAGRPPLADAMIDRYATEALRLEAAQRGDREAFDRLVAPYRSKLDSFLRTRVRDADTAQTLTQSTFYEAYRALSNFRGECPFDRWLWRIALRVLSHQYRYESSRRASSLDDMLETTDFKDDDQSSEEIETHRWLEDLLAIAREVCSDVQVSVLLMFARTGSFDETAELLQLKPATCRSHFLRGRTLILAEVIVNHPGLVGGSETVHAVAEKLKRTGPPIGLDQQEIDALVAARVRTAPCQSACLKVARELPNPLSSWSA